MFETFKNIDKNHCYIKDYCICWLYYL